MDPDNNFYKSSVEDGNENEDSYEIDDESKSASNAHLRSDKESIKEEVLERKNDLKMIE